MKFVVLFALIICLISTPVHAMPLDGTEIPGPPNPREFPSLEFFEKWRDTRLLLYVEGRAYRLPVVTYSSVKDCDDVAETWQRRALGDGFLISAQAIQYGKLLGVRVSKTRTKHDGIRANIGNNVYYLDTYYPYDITLVCRRDKE